MTYRDALMSKQVMSIFHSVMLAAVTYFSIKYAVDFIATGRRERPVDFIATGRRERDARAKALRTLGKSNIDTSKFDEFELMIASHLVDPSSIETGWKDVAGLDDVIEELKTSVVYPLTNPKLSSYSKLHSPPKGVLLYGPPGCGKTLIAKATAKESGARFIDLVVSSLSSKWYGESQKLTAALFSLAIKLEPCIIFIDEIDSLLRERANSDHEVTAMMKAQFLMLWDGLNSGNNKKIVIIGATNRPGELDKAIIRRMPLKFHIGLPAPEKRKDIFQLTLKGEDVSHDINYDRLCDMTEGFSGDDIREVCREAAMVRVRELSDVEGNIPALRSISMGDFEKALTKFQKSKYSLGLDTSH